MIIGAASPWIAWEFLIDPCVVPQTLAVFPDG
jgi:hypothetical protein